MKKIAFSIEGMTCQHCVKAVERAARALPGLAEIKVSLDENRAEVEFDESRLALDAIEAAIVEEGYKVRPV